MTTVPGGQAPTRFPLVTNRAREIADRIPAGPPRSRHQKITRRRQDRDRQRRPGAGSIPKYWRATPTTLSTMRNGKAGSKKRMYHQASNTVWEIRRDDNDDQGNTRPQDGGRASGARERRQRSGASGTTPRENERRLRFEHPARILAQVRHDIRDAEKSTGLRIRTQAASRIARRSTRITRHTRAATPRQTWRASHSVRSSEAHRVAGNTTRRLTAHRGAD